MSALVDARRFFWLGAASTDCPLELLEALVRECERLGMVRALGDHERAQRTQLESKIVELQTRLKEANARTRQIEHQVVLLEEQLKGEHLFKRVVELEAELKKANERTRLVEHKLVQVTSQNSKRH